MKYKKYRLLALVALFVAYPSISFGLDYATYKASLISGVTIINPVALLALIVTAILMFKLPRRQAIIPFFVMTFLIPMNQRIAIATLDLYLFRILIIVGWIRLITHSEFYPPKKNAIDKTIYFLVFISSVTYILLWQTTGAIINRLGYVMDFLGLYILLRSLIRDFDDIDRIIKLFVFISVFIAVSMIIEQITQRNLFYVFGGVPEFTALRDGRLRSQATFGHPIYTGTFGAVILPLFVSLWKRTERNRLLAITGIISATIITFTSSSSGPILTYLAAIIALFLFAFRRYMNVVRWGILFALVSLHFYMKAPVWALIDRVAIFGSSTAYHRFLLVDQFIRRFNEWWLFGTKSTVHWGHESLQMWDITNQFIRIGVDGGFISFSLFILLIILCFRRIGKGLKVFEHDYNRLFLIWTLGAMLFAHITAFMGVSYYSQIFLVWLLTIAMISTVSDLSERPVSLSSQ